MSVTALEDIAAGAPGADLWFQLYIWQNRRMTEALLDRVQAEASRPWSSLPTPRPFRRRNGNVRNGFGMPMVPSLRAAIDFAVHPRWLAAVLLRYAFGRGLPIYSHYPEEFKTRITRSAVTSDLRIADRMTWDDLRDLRRNGAASSW
jgi:L-lactate dehydrogenase (cytochrome)